MFYNPYNERELSQDKACYLLRSRGARLPSGHPVGWDFEVLAAYERDQGDSGIGTGMHNQVIGWVNDLQVEGRQHDQDMATPLSYGSEGTSGG